MRRPTSTEIPLSVPLTRTPVVFQDDPASGAAPVRPGPVLPAQQRYGPLPGGPGQQLLPSQGPQPSAAPTAHAFS